MTSLYYLTSDPTKPAPNWAPLTEIVTQAGWPARLTPDENPRVLRIDIPDEVLSYGQVAQWVELSAEEIGIMVVPTDARRAPGSPWGAATEEQRQRSLEGARAISYADTRGLNWELRRIAGEAFPRRDDRPGRVAVSDESDDDFYGRGR